MNAELPQPRSITDIKVDSTPLGATGIPRVTIQWIDGAGSQQEIERYARAAYLIITDLHAATLVGEASRQAYLVGFIRCHSLRRGSD
jgi:hypothetical protein